MIKDSWFIVEEINPRTFAISEHGSWEKVHSFLLLGDTEAVLIDTGQGIDNIKRVTDQLTELPIRVLTTHVHFDHIGSHGEFDQIYVHKEDADSLINGVEGVSLDEIRGEICRNLIRRTPDSFDLNTYIPYQGEPTGLLEDGDLIDIGDRQLEIYHTPGLSPGHICIFDVTYGYLFTGDILYNQTPISTYYPSASPSDLVESLEKICDIKGVSMVYGSHNTLGLDIEVLEETREAIEYLEQNNLVKFGSGLHAFETISFLF